MLRPERTDVLGVPCPCGSGTGYQRCCGPLHHGARQAATAEELMRSRYSAYARADADYLFRTWHPRTRPLAVTIDADVVWTGLEVMDADAGGVDDDSGVVEFVAHFVAGGVPSELRERSSFQRRAGRWTYVDGDQRVGTPQTE